jgi:hypothetical protein
MKRLRVDLIIVFTLFILLIMSFSIVKGDSPIIVRNTTTMDTPYETGFADYGENDGKKDAQSDSQYDAQQGLVYASAFASKTSIAWAYSYLQDAFEIIHSSNYNITFSFDYKGLIEITGVDPPLFPTANARVDLTACLIRRDGEEIIDQKTETIASVTENFAQIITDQRSITLTIALEENNIYDWRAELRTEASASNYIHDTAEATVNFYDISQGYRAEIMQVSVEDLNPDYIPPTTTYSLSGTEGENDWFTSSVTTSLSATDNLYGVDYTNQRVNGASWTHYTSTFSISSEGANTFEFYSVDKAGNEETTQSVNIKIDLNPPTGQLRINNNAPYTSSRDVSLTTLTQDGQGSGVTQMRFRNQGESYGGTWIPYTTSPTPWTLREGDGNKRVYAQFKDEAGNISPETYDEIILDTETPTTSASFSGTSGENDWFTSSVTTSLNSIDNYGVDYTNWRINDGPWNPYASPFSISSEGTNTFEFYSVDKAGNEETTQSVSIKIDKTEPTASVLINNGDTYSSTTMVTLSLTYSDAASGVSEVRYSNDGFWDTEAWEDHATTKNWNLISGDGEKTVYYQTKDYAGKLSPITYDEIILDTEPPLASILINKGDEYTNSTFVTLYLQYSDNQGIDLVRYSNDEVSYTKWERPSETREWTLLSGDGIKTVYAQFRDWAGLNSNFVSDTIILDTIPPTGSIEINDGASSTTSTSVTITPNATDANGVAQMRLNNDGGNWSDWEEVTTKTWNLTSGLGAKTVFAQFKDNAGLISPSYNATINLVEPEPTPSPAPSPTPQPSPTPSGKGNIIVFVKDENNNPISGATVTSTVQPSGQSPLSGVTNSRGSVTFNDIIAGSYSLNASKSGFGNNDVQVTVKSQQTAVITIPLREDLNEPTVSVTLNPEDSDIPQRTFTVTAEDDIQGSGIAKITLYVDEVPVAIWTTAGTHNYDAGVYSIGTHTYYVEAVDNAGNRARNPASGDLKFTVVEGAYMKQTELWKLIGVVLVLANGTALLFFSLKRKKGKQ